MELIFMSFDNEHEAEEVRETLYSMEVDYLIDVKDAVVVIRDTDGELTVKPPGNQTLEGAVTGGLWGLILGTIVGFAALPFTPAVSLLAGGAGAVMGGLQNNAQDYGLSDDFVDNISQNLTPGSSALLLLIYRADTEQVIAELKRFNGNIIRSSFSPEVEAKLQDSLRNNRVKEPA